MTGAIFPGIGSERDGMLSLVKENFLKDLNLADEKELTLQKSIYAVSASLWDGFKSRYKFSLLAGHSLGFYSALYAANSIDYKTGLYLISFAHRAIKKATGNNAFGMTAIIGIRWDIIENFCRGLKNIYIANINSATQVVVAGYLESLKEFEKRIYDEGAFKVLRLSINYPLHTPILKGSSDFMREAIKDIEIKQPSIPIVDHTTGEILTSLEQIKETLTNQFTRKVIWRDVVMKMWQYGVRRFVEVGPGEVLSKITRWIERDAEVICLDVQI
jgi:[acyl-carrier-protein] S-malonyltransferase